MIGYFLRNVEQDEQGRSIGHWDGYQAGHALEMVKGFWVGGGKQDLAACEEAFGMFNRGSGVECYFQGPSLSVGDLVVIEHEDRSRAAFQCAALGFHPIEWEPRFDEMIQQANGPGFRRRKEAEK